MTPLAHARHLLDQGSSAQAAAACRVILADDVVNAQALWVLGLALLGQGRPAEAVAMLAGIPDLDAAMLADLGAALMVAGLLAEAEVRLRDALDRDPACQTGVLRLATLLRDTGRADQARVLVDAALAAAPADAGLREALAAEEMARGNLALTAHDPAAAEACYRAALDLAPGLVPALGNLATAQVAQGRLADGLAGYRAALDRDPTNANIGCGYALALLLAGDLAEGWRWHECRRQVDAMRGNYDRRHEVAHWHPGGSLAGRRVLVMAEQGLGDVVQYARFVGRLAERAASVVLEVLPPLAGLFDGMAGVDATILPADPTPDCDIACPLLSLPLALGLSGADIAAPVPYVLPRPGQRARWADWLARGAGRRRIGLVCSGDARHPNDALRSIPLARLAPLLAVPDCQFVLVQNEIRPDDRMVRDRMVHDRIETLRFPGAALTGFVETAGLVSHLDLLITVDTAVAHLTGAMGIPVWLMLAHVPDHRWLLGRDDSPWYPSARLYRQPARGDWDAVTERIRHDLALA